MTPEGLEVETQKNKTISSSSVMLRTVPSELKRRNGKMDVLTFLCKPFIEQYDNCFEGYLFLNEQV